MVYYCYGTSPSIELKDVNLQLDSLQKAAQSWNDLVKLIKMRGNGDQHKEKLVFIVNCFGISLAQLFGQNDPFPTHGKRYPIKILKDILANHSEIDHDETCHIESMYEEFNGFYNAGHHFGKLKHKKIDGLTVEKLDDFRRLTIKIWDIVCGVFLFDENGTKHSVAEVVYFSGLD